MTKIAISPPRPLLEQTLTEETPSHVLAEARMRYTAIEDNDLALAEDFLTVAVETLPPFEH